MPRLNARHWWLLSAIWFAIAGAFWAFYFEKNRQLNQLQYEQVKLRHVFDMLQRPVVKSKTEVSDPAELLRHVDALSRPRFTESERDWARRYIIREMTRCGYAPARQTFEGGLNIIATKTGSVKDAPIFVVGAHYDTVQNSPGANDNASGVVALIHIACRLKLTETKFTYRFIFFDGEERNMLGSKAYLKDHRRSHRLVGAIILEMIGSKCTDSGCQMWPNSMPTWMKRDSGDFIAVIGDIAHPRLMNALAQSGATNRPPIHTIPVSDAGHAVPNSRRSDHSSFWDFGIDAVMVTDTGNFRYTHYHQVHDVSEHLDYEFMAGVVDIVFDAIINIDTSKLSFDAVNLLRSRRSE